MKYFTKTMMFMLSGLLAAPAFAESQGNQYKTHKIKKTLDEGRYQNRINSIKQAMNSDITTDQYIKLQELLEILTGLHEINTAFNEATDTVFGDALDRIMLQND